MFRIPTKKHNQLRARWALILFTDVPLKTRRVLLLYKVYGDSALLVLSGTSLNSVYALQALSRRDELTQLHVNSQICMANNNYRVFLY